MASLRRAEQAASVHQLLLRVERRLWTNEAVKNALRFKWSNGQLEGQVNRLKLIKRQMYGRAKFDLLRARVLHSI